MTPYANLSGKSNVASYQEDWDAINVTFKDGSTYRYTYASAGEGIVEEMKNLARVGKGLNSFINRRAKYLYAYKR